MLQYQEQMMVHLPEDPATGQGNLFCCNKNTMPCFSILSRWQFICQESLPQDNNTSTTTQTMPSHASASYADDNSSSLGLCHRQGNNFHCNKNTKTYFGIMHRWQFFCRRLPQDKETLSSATKTQTMPSHASASCANDSSSARKLSRNTAYQYLQQHTLMCQETTTGAGSITCHQQHIHH